MVINIVLFNHNVFFTCVCRNKKDCFLNTLFGSRESLVTLELPSDFWVVFWTNESEEQVLLLCVQTYQKTIDVPFMDQIRDNEQIRKEFPFIESSREMTEKDEYKSNEMQLQNQSSTFNFHSEKEITSFKYQHSISLTRGLQHYCLLGQDNLYRLCGLWQMPGEIGVLLWVQKNFHSLGCKSQSLQERWQQRVPTGTKSYNEGGRFQPAYAVEESAGHCSRKLC